MGWRLAWKGGWKECRPFWFRTEIDVDRAKQLEKSEGRHNQNSNKRKNEVKTNNKEKWRFA